MKSEWIGSFPFSAPRDQQVTAIDHAIETFDAGRKFEMLEMGVGCGKSAVAATLAHWMAVNTVSMDDVQSGAYILTSQKILQDQYVRDFGHHVHSIKSASSYQCSAIAATCSEAKKLSQIAAAAGSPLNMSCRDNCAYRVAKQAFIDSDISLTNYAFFMNDVAYAKDLHKRSLMVIDECHTLESALCSMAELQMSERGIGKLVNASIPTDVSIESIRDWLVSLARPISDAIKASQLMIKMLAKSSLSSPQAAEEARKLDKLSKLASKAARIARLLDDTWCISRDVSDVDGTARLMLRPTDVSSVADTYLFKFATRVMMMSATICDPRVMCSALGISQSNVRFLSMPSPFDPALRPVIYAPAGKMSFANVSQTMPIMIETVRALIDEHPDSKGIVHTGNYKISRALQATLPNSRAIFHDETNRDAALAQHLSDPGPTVLFSPSMTDGVDLHDELSRFQVICKLPFPNASDSWVKKRMSRDSRWYAWMTASKISQAVGRSVRHETDWAHTYILDECWERFYSDSHALFSESFKEALVM